MKYQQSKLSTADRQDQVNSVIQSLENGLELLCITGVEDQLQVWRHNISLTLSVYPVHINRWMSDQLWSSSEMLELKYSIVIINTKQILREYNISAQSKHVLLFIDLDAYW